MNADPAPASGSTTYSYRPSVLGAPWEFSLTGEGIAYQAGRKSGHVAFRDVRRVRLSFRPSTIQTNRFVTELWSAGAPKLQIVSTSWKSMVEQERRDPAYSAFIHELHRRIVQSAAPARFELGVNPAIYWFGVALFVVVAFALAGLIVRGIQSHFWSGAAFIAAFFAAFLWQSGNYFRRNRPGRYSPDAVPADLMPKV